VSERLNDGLRVERLAPILAAALAFAVALWASRPYAVGVFHDDGVYAVLAKSIATGQGYRYLHLPGAPEATHYPPGYPLLLALLWRIAPVFPANVALFLFVNAALLALTAWCVERFARTVLDWNCLAAATAAVVATVSYPLLMLSGLVLSEPLFAALLLPVLIGAENVARRSSGDASLHGASHLRAFAIGASAGLLALVRTHAAAVAIAILLVLALRGRWRSAVMTGAGFAMVLAPWEVWTLTHGQALAEPLRGSYGSYTAWLADGFRSGGPRFIWHTVALNVRESAALLADRFSLGDLAGPRSITACGVGLLLAAGAWSAARKAPVTVLFAVLYFAILLVWPYTPWRFVFAAWPLVVLFLGELAAAVLRARERLVWPVRGLAFGVAALVVVGALREETRAYATRAWMQPADAATAQIAPLVRWVAQTTSSDDVVAVEGEQLVYLFTGRHALPLAPFTAAEYVQPRTADQGSAWLQRILKDFRVNYVLTISPPMLASAGRLVSSTDAAAPRASRDAHLVPIRLLPGGAVFRVERP